MKKVISLIFGLCFILSLAACGGTMEGVKDDAQSIGESVASGTESIVDNASSTIKENKTNIMAGITAKQAEEAALKHAGFAKNQVKDIDVDLDRDGNRLIYEVDFEVGNTEYDYDIDAENGNVISFYKSKD